MSSNNVSTPEPSASPVFSCNEWDPLEEVVLGTAVGAQVPRPDKNLHCISYANLAEASQIPSGPYPQWVIDEAEEDLENIAHVLRKLGVTVRRPAPLDFPKTIRTRRWEADGFYNYGPRDLHLVVENRIIEAPMTLRSRQFEAEAYAPLFREYTKAGAAWIAATKPFLAGEHFDRTNLAESTLLNFEPVFDAANIIRCGRDLFFLISNTGNEMGRIWLQNILGPQFRVHAAVNVYSLCHVDSGGVMWQISTNCVGSDTRARTGERIQPWARACAASFAL